MARAKQRVWTTACTDWEKRIVARRSLIPFKPLFPNEARDGIEQLKQLQIVDAPNSPLIGEVGREWIYDFAGAIFGSYDRQTGVQLIREFMLHVSKKNWKSGLAASIMTTILVRNWRKSAEFLILAPTVEVANNSFMPARDMITADEDLSDIFHIQEHIRTITHRETKASLKVIAADSEAVGGKKASVVLIDELWLFGKKAGAENMLREATGGLASRPEGLVIYLTTQSDEPPAGVFRSKLQYARKVRDGLVDDPKFLPVLYEFPAAMVERKEYLDPAKFYVTNPNLGASVDAEFLERELHKAQESGQESLVGFLAKHLNVEIGLALQSDRWTGADYWQDATDTTLTLDEVIERSEVLTIGIDGGGLDDLFGLGVLGRDGTTGEWLHWGHAWAHKTVLEQRKSEAPRLLGFAEDGDLTIVEEPDQDLAEITEVCSRCEQSGKLDQIGIDQVGIGGLIDALIAAEIDEKRLVAISQGWRLTGAIKTAERKLKSRGLRHGGSKLMAWCVGNARVEPRGNAITITKQAAGKAKIDPLMALFNAVDLMSRNPAPKGALVTEDLLVL
jgi:phage terminase large subunit-like protein